jgi:hypothetical protein
LDKHFYIYSKQLNRFCPSRMKKNNKKINIFYKHKWLIIFIIIVSLAIIYSVGNPAESKYFPKCPFYTLTHYQCPGCGSQRAIHDLLKLNFKQAAKQNLLLLLLLPYIALGVFWDLHKPKKNKNIKLYKKIFGYKSSIFILILILFFWFFRNTHLYHHIMHI